MSLCPGLLGSSRRRIPLWHDEIAPSTTASTLEQEDWLVPGLRDRLQYIPWISSPFNTGDPDINLANFFTEQEDSWYSEQSLCPATSIPWISRFNADDELLVQVTVGLETEILFIEFTESYNPTNSVIFIMDEEWCFLTGGEITISDGGMIIDFSETW